MKMKAALQSNKGSSLIIIVLMIMLLSTLCISVLAISLGGLQTNVASSEMNEAYYVAETGVQQIAMSLDKLVAQYQELARQNASIIEKNWLDTWMNRLKVVDLNNPAAFEADLARGDCPYFADYSVKSSVVKKKFDDEYAVSLTNQLLAIDTGVDARKNLLPVVDTLAETLSAQGTSVIKSTSTSQIIFTGMNLLPPALIPRDIFDDTIATNADGTEKKKNAYVLNSTTGGFPVELHVTGKYFSSAKVHSSNNAANSTYTKRLSVTVNLLPNPATQYYQSLPKMKVNPEVPPIFKKAVVAEKNIIAAGGVVNISGDVECFGTIPLNGTDEDQDAPWYQYGGILAGMCSDVYGEIVDTENLGNSNLWKLDPDEITRSDIGGVLNITGNATTMSYVHTLYGDDSLRNTSNNGQYSDINITGKTFARSIRSEENARHSKITFNGDVYTLDNLQVDSDDSIVKLNKKYYGFVDSTVVTHGTDDGTSNYQYKRTSSIVMSGVGSNLYLNGTKDSGGVFIGGSAFFMNITGPGTGYPYMAGISAYKENQMTTEAFEADKTNKIFIMNPSGNYEESPNLQSYSSYKKILPDGTSQTIDMLNGDQGQKFMLPERANHFKGVWEMLWKSTLGDFRRAGYVDRDSIWIKTGVDGSGHDVYSGNIYGFSYGAVVANDNVYGPNEIKDPADTGLNMSSGKWANTVQKTCKTDFSGAISDFVDTSGGVIDQAVNSKHVSDVIHSSSESVDDNPAANKIQNNKVYQKPGSSFLYYGSNGDIRVSVASGGLTISNLSGAGSSTTIGNNGIIYSSGNIYVEDGVTLNGVMLASKNIVFKKDATINYSGAVINSLLNGDNNIGLLFGTRTFDVTDTGTLRSQRVSLTNIKITAWKEE